MKTWETYASLHFWLHVGACRSGSAFGVLSGHYWASFSCKDRASCWQRCCRSSFKHQEGCRWRKRNQTARLVWHVGPGKSRRQEEADVPFIVPLYPQMARSQNLKQVGLQQPLMTRSECLKTYVGAFLAFQSTSQNHFRILPVVYEDL